MTELQKKVDALCQQVLQAPDGTEHVWLYDAYHLALEMGWIDQDTYHDGMRLRNAGGYLEASLRLVPPDCQWLVRNDEEAGAFANVSFPGPVPTMIQTADGWVVDDPTRRFKTYAKNPALAVIISCLQAWAAIYETLETPDEKA